MFSLTARRAKRSDVQGLEQILKKLGSVDLCNAQSYGDYSIPSRDFGEWIDFAQGLDNADKVRAALYYVFQQLYDALIDGSIREERAIALSALEKTVKVSSDYLVGYYLGKPDIPEFKRSLGDISELSLLGRVAYYKKFRNLNNDGFVNMVACFFHEFIKLVVKGKLHKPNYVIGCACGSSEVVMPLAKMLGIDMGFIRMSKNRYDVAPKIIQEQEEDIRNKVKGSVVVCVEDIVCYGGYK